MTKDLGRTTQQCLYICWIYIRIFKMASMRTTMKKCLAMVNQRSGTWISFELSNIPNENFVFSFLNRDRVNHPSPAEELFDPASADTIMSFVNQESSPTQGIVSERLGGFSLGSAQPSFQHLHFDLSEVRPEFQLIGAELRIFYNGTISGRTGGRVNVFALRPASYESRER